ncbi:hypothetical protein QT979_02055 [Microcoleus sp. w2-18bC1]|uniref:hypothetical protein n=1 Tax=unclassified Microcoleus TaxID=2642155 RepID=UPI002FD48DFE
MLIVLVKAEAVARGFTIFWIFPTPNFAGLLTLGRIFGFFPIPQPSFTKTLIYLILLNNSAFPEKANKGGRNHRNRPVVSTATAGQEKQTLPLWIPSRIYPREEICPQLPRRYLPS